MKYGWYGPDALAVCIEDECRNEALGEYVADMLCLIARPNYTTEISLFSELYGGNEVKNNMTADEIFDHVMDKLEEYSKKGA